MQLFFTGCQTSFNSHPHKEDDRRAGTGKNQPHLSTHILTRRMTMSVIDDSGDKKPFNSHPHKEDDDTKRKSPQEDISFNSHPHKEDDSNFKQKHSV